MSVDETLLKTQFACAWLRNPRNPYAAAMVVFPVDCGRAMLVSREWIFDAEVLAIKEAELAEHGPEGFLPDEFEQARDLYDLAMSDRIDPKDRLGFHKLYAELRGHIKKEAATVVNNLTDNRSVMIVKDHGTNEEWEAKLQRQQAALVNDARSIN